MPAAFPSLRSVLVRLLRIGLLGLAIFCLREAQQRREREAERQPITPDQVRDLFPSAASIEPDDGSGWQAVHDAQGKVIGSVAQTSPDSDGVIGYSGATNTLIAKDAAGAVVNLRILHSNDTPDHVAEVVADRAFFAQFRGKHSDALQGLIPDTVSGATLTSSAIAEGVLNRLGRTSEASLRFPDDITLDEVHALEPQAITLRPTKQIKGAMDVLDGNGAVIGIAVRTSPVTDSLIGYKGPSDTLLVLDAKGETLRAIALRKSYDTKRYVAYITGDRYFLNLFNDRPIADLAVMDFEKEKVEGVSGATETSWAMAEGIKRRASAWVKQQTPPPTWWSRIRWRWQDTGHVAVILSALCMAFGPLRGRAWLRNAHHGLLVVYAGFISGEMLSQALLTGWAAHGTPWRSAPGLVLLVVVALLGPVVTRRQLYCHHICPHGALQHLIARRLPWQWSPGKAMERWLSLLPWALLLLAVAVAMLALRVDLNAIEPFDAYLFRVAGWAALVIAAAGLVFALFTPLAYCRYGCPTGAVFKLLRFAGDADRPGWRDAAAFAGIMIFWGLSHAT